MVAEELPLATEMTAVRVSLSVLASAVRVTVCCPASPDAGSMVSHDTSVPSEAGCITAVHWPGAVKVKVVLPPSAAMTSGSESMVSGVGSFSWQLNAATAARMIHGMIYLCSERTVKWEWVMGLNTGRWRRLSAVEREAVAGVPAGWMEIGPEYLPVTLFPVVVEKSNTTE